MDSGPETSRPPASGAAWRKRQKGPRAAIRGRTVRVERHHGSSRHGRTTPPARRCVLRARATAPGSKWLGIIRCWPPLRQSTAGIEALNVQQAAVSTVGCRHQYPVGGYDHHPQAAVFRQITDGCTTAAPSPRWALGQPQHHARWLPRIGVALRASVSWCGSQLLGVAFTPWR